MKKLLSISLFLLSALFVQGASRQDYEDIDAFLQTIKLIKEDFDGNISTEELISSAIKGMIQELDPHSNFFKKKDFANFLNQADGHFGGLGIIISKMGKYVTIVEPIEGTPAYKSGLTSGDKIIKVDGIDVVGLDINKLVKKLKGTPGSKVKVTIDRFGHQKTFNITRAIVSISSVPDVIMLENYIGYIKLRQFNNNTTREFVKGINDLKSLGAKRLIIDLRNNPGGLLNQAMNILDEFIEKKKLLLMTKSKNKKFSRKYYSKKTASVKDMPIVVLINSGTASASEIFAGSLQDYDKCIVIGQQSYGKGSVQQTYSLKNSDGIKLTISKYYIPSGRCVHNTLNDSLLKVSDDLSIKELEKMQKENQLANKSKIFKTVGGRVVYGGGGITPDIIVDRNEYSQLEKDFIINNSYFKFSLDYYQKNGKNITENFVTNSRVMAEFLRFVKREQNIKFKKATADSIRYSMEVNIQSNILKRKFGSELAQKKLFGIDPDIVASIEILKKSFTPKDMFENAKKYNTQNEKK